LYVKTDWLYLPPPVRSTIRRRPHGFIPNRKRRIIAFFQTASARFAVEAV